jgi:TrmH family RNA methyltransferase
MVKLKIPKSTRSMANKLDNLRIVLVATRNPLNIGAAARAMSNFGAKHLRAVNPYDVAFREARSAVGAADLVASAKVYDTLAQAIADCALVVGTTAAEGRQLQHELVRLEKGARVIARRLNSGPVALLFGSEKRGLSNEDLDHCHWLIRIPTRDEHGSMNLGQAVAICLYELARLETPTTSAKQKRIKRDKDTLPVKAETLERVTHLLFDVLNNSGYIKPRTSAPTEAKLRRMVRRLHLNATDAELWLGILRQIDWQLAATRPNKADPQP